MEFRQYPEDINFGKYWLILKRHWFPATSVFILVMLLGGAIAALQKPVYEAEGRLLFKKRDTASTLLSDGTERIGELEPLSQQNTPIDTEAEVLRSIPLIEKLIESLNLKNRLGEPATPDDVLEDLTVKGIKGTDILSVSYQSPDPQEAATVVNQLIKSYIESNILLNRSETTATREFINRQLPETEAQLKRAEARLRNFEENNNVINLVDEATTTVASIAQLNEQIAKVNADLANTTAQTAALQSKIELDSKAAIAVNALSQSPGVQEVLTQLQQVSAQLAVEQVRFQKSSPIIVRLEERQAALQAVLQERVAQVVGDNQSVPQANLQAGQSEQNLIDSFVQAEVTRLGLANQVNSLIAAQAIYKNRAALLPQLNQQQKELERQVKTIQSRYDILVKRGQEVLIAENQNMGNARIVASATAPKRPIASKKKLILAGSAVVGGLLYIITAFVLDLRDPSIKTAKEIREIFKYPWLGMIPLLKKRHGSAVQSSASGIPELSVKDSAHALVGESYQMLQSNLRFLNPDRTVKTIVVTSSVSKEGKSTVSANLAIALSQMGRKVLLVDADLHHPIQHHIWQLTNAAGLSNVIANQTNLESAIQGVQDHLSVLPSGAIPPNPLALLDSHRMASLMEKFSQDYDFVIIDTPPLILVPDVLALGKLSDGILLVVRPGIIDSESTATAKDLLLQTGLEVLGLVINGVIAKNEPNDYLRHAKAYHKESALPELVGLKRD
jgi:polysaccharide biosynthesis transport protein